MGNKRKINLIAEEEAFVVVNKEAGLLSIPDRFDASVPNLKQMLRKQLGEIYTVHRLDRDTSGVICFACTTDAHRILSTQFSAHEPAKRYWALVEGTLKEEQGQIDRPIIEDIRRPGKMTVTDKNGEKAKAKRAIIETGKTQGDDIEVLTETLQTRISGRYRRIRRDPGLCRRY